MNNESIINRKLTLPASVSEVWDALVNPKKTKQFMFNCEVNSDWKIGNPIVWKGNYEGYESGERGVILEFDEGKRLKYTSFDPNFGLADTEENYLHISYDLSAKGDNSTELVTTIENFNGDAKRNGHLAAGWDIIVLPALQKLFIK
ncbi:SRPBCC domain-containing protein [Dyadobacter sp. LJ53]|uniref:SRPBCC family protein n=1 Tax=Dyadobacter chenwenxiniae TaxID=2906456 RepID=UPI001F38D2DE|nr:SRPBCC domain-containing protein [Dyadobacter chenwenxiniae]MCF0051735.1 SRPBCC domain-containing protein [Dyadobacter chenwenxiniae]